MCNTSFTCLAQAMALNRTLEHLDVGDCALVGDAGVAALCKSVRPHPALTSLNVHATSMGMHSFSIDFFFVVDCMAH
jgi:hypothetical protein